MKQDYELIIIGGGPAGLTAGLYASRARLDTLLIERGMMGGLIADAELVENFPGFPQGIHGSELGELLREQATRFGLETVNAEVTEMQFNGHQRRVKTTEATSPAQT